MSKGFSLHIGLNAVDSEHYSGWNGKLNACETDAKSMAAIANSLKYTKISTLLTQQATREAVINEIKKAAAESNSGDIFFITYSGHGGRVTDLNGDESDKLDETWCLFDGEFLDDELYELWWLFKEDVRIIVLSDSCHSGTITRNMYYGLSDETNINKEESKVYRFIPKDISKATYQKNKDFYNRLNNSTKHENLVNNLNCSIKLISGCQDNQTSLDGEVNGLFTEKLLNVWDNGNFRGNYSTFYKSIIRLMPPSQTPNYLNIGKNNTRFNNEIPFTI
jgi:hypothetical protein